MQTQKLIIYLLLISLACGCIGNDENSDEDDDIDYPEYLEVNDYRVFIFSSTKQKENLSGTFIILPMLMFLNGTTISLTDIYYNVHNHYHWPEIGKEIPSELNISYAMKDFTYRVERTEYGIGLNITPFPILGIEIFFKTSYVSNFSEEDYLQIERFHDGGPGLTFWKQEDNNVSTMIYSSTSFDHSIFFSFRRLKEPFTIDDIGSKIYLEQGWTTVPLIRYGIGEIDVIC